MRWTRCASARMSCLLAGNQVRSCRVLILLVFVQAHAVVPAALSAEVEADFVGGESQGAITAPEEATCAFPTPVRQCYAAGGDDGSNGSGDGSPPLHSGPGADALARSLGALLTAY